MIRRSAAIAVAALVLSLMMHFFGIALTIPDVSSRETAGRLVEQVALGDAFEDLAEQQTAPVEPEPAEVPEPAVETPPEPERAEEPTSEALVASTDPRPVAAPDKGTVRAAEPSVTGPVTPQAGDTPEPQVDTPSGGTETAVSDARITPPVGSDAESASAGSPEGETTTSPPITPPTAPSVATAPIATEPVAPVADAVVSEVIAALPPEAVTPEETLSAVEPQQEEIDGERSGESITTSLRPQLRPENQPPQPRGTVDGTADQSNGLRAPTELIESPLTAYQRDGTNLFAGQRGGAQSGGAGFGDALGPGNSDVTNYAGEVLMHLNRVPPVAVSSRGWARVVFRIEPNGSLAFVDIIDGSGSSDIERAAKAHVGKGVPFPRPPEGKSRVLNFIYRIE
ncbi:MAG: TonB C-terminal domain-containing protein [Roseobacter sp.]